MFTNSFFKVLNFSQDNVNKKCETHVSFQLLKATTDT